MTVTKDKKIGDILDFNARAADILQKAGMPCAHCPSARTETIEQACRVYDMDPKPLISRTSTRFLRFSADERRRGA